MNSLLLIKLWEQRRMLTVEGSRTIQPRQQTLSPLPARQRHQGFIGDRHKTSASSINYGRPILPPIGHASNVSTSGALGSQQLVVSILTNGIVTDCYWCFCSCAFPNWFTSSFPKHRHQLACLDNLHIIQGLFLFSILKRLLRQRREKKPSGGTRGQRSLVYSWQPLSKVQKCKTHQKISSLLPICLHIREEVAESY